MFFELGPSLYFMKPRKMSIEKTKTKSFPFFVIK